MDPNQYFHFTSNLSFSLSSQLGPYWCSVACCGVNVVVNFFKLPFHPVLATGKFPELLQGWGGKETSSHQMLNCCFSFMNCFVGFKMFFLVYFQHWVSVWPLIMVPDFPLQDLIPSFSDDVTSLPWAVLKITSMQLPLWNLFVLGKETETLGGFGQPQPSVLLVPWPLTP